MDAHDDAPEPAPRDLLQRAAADPAAHHALLEALHRVAHVALARERHASIETTDLAHEVLLRMAGTDEVPLHDAQNLRRFVARVTRNVLVDRARKRNAAKRGGDEVRVTYTDAAHGTVGLEVDVLALHHALDRLRALDARTADIVELRVFGGASAEEVGGMLGVSRATVQNEWAFALTWLRKALSEG